VWIFHPVLRQWINSLDYPDDSAVVPGVAGVARKIAPDRDPDPAPAPRYYDMARRSLTEPAAATPAAAMKASLIRYQQALDDLLMVARFERARTRFNQAVIVILAGGLVTALGLAMLLYGIASKTGK
jgi:hypothetical protein